MATHLTAASNLKNAGFGISTNNNDSKIETAINEAEMIHVKPRITDALYLDLLKWVEAADKSGFPAKYEVLMNGGEWQSSNGCGGETVTRCFGGLINTVNYYAYARLILVAGDNITRFSMVHKAEEYSQRHDYKEKQAAYAAALHTADIFMNDVVLFLEDSKSDIPLFKRAGKAKNRLAIQVIK